MKLDDEVCLCFHVTKRKLLSFLRIHKPRRPAQLSECFGAGTGCGWCRKYLVRMFDNAQIIVAAKPGTDPLPDDDAAPDYAKHRADYIRAGGGTPPPGATPIE